MKQCAETLDPLAPVEKVPLVTQDGMTKSSRYAVMLDPQGINREVGIVSEGYQLVPNDVVHGTALEVLHRASMKCEEGGLIFDGKRYRQRWILPGLEVQPKPGDVVRLTLDAVNSYDGSTLFGLAFNATRLVCSNGLMVDFLLGGFKFKHYGGNGTFEHELQQAARRVTSLAAFLPPLTDRLKSLVDRPMHRQHIQQAFKDLQLPRSIQADAFMAIDESTAWGFLNGCTDVLTRLNTHRADNLNRQIVRHLFAA